MSSEAQNQVHIESSTPRTQADFSMFCQIILNYENYQDSEDDNQDLEKTTNDNESWITDLSNSSTNLETNDRDNDDAANTMNDDGIAYDLSTDNLAILDDGAESYNSITCFCGKPYAARPMIECSSCLTWLHFSCAKINRKQIPDVFICRNCTHSNALRDNQLDFSIDSPKKVTRRSRFRTS